MDKEKLKPCPFCGKEARFTRVYEHYFDGSKRCIKEFIQCIYGCCKMNVPHTEKYTTQAWNRRVKQ